MQHLAILWNKTCVHGVRRVDVKIRSPTDPIRVGGDLISPITSVRDLGIYLDSLTPTWGRMFWRPCRTALLHSAVYVSHFLGRWCCPWWCRWFCSDSTLAMQHSPASQATSWADCSPSLTLLHDLSSRGVGMTTLHHFFRSCTGWESSSGSSSSSQYSSSAAWTAWLRRTYPMIYNACQNWWRVDVCIRRQRRRSSSHLHAFPPATALSPWLRRGHGTACRHLSHRCLRWRPSGVSWRWNCLPAKLSWSRQLCLQSHLTDTLFTFCVALAFCHCFSVVRCPCSHFDITLPKSYLFIIIII